MTSNLKNNSESEKNIFQVFTDSETKRIAETTPGTCQEKVEYIVEETMEIVAVCLGYNLFK